MDEQQTFGEGLHAGEQQKVSLQFVLPSLPSISSLPPVPFDPTHQQTLE
jgi:hypothetical protein